MPTLTDIDMADSPRSFAHRAFTALRALSERSLAVIAAALARPPFTALVSFSTPVLAINQPLFLEGVLAGRFLKAYERGQTFAAMMLTAADDPARRSEILRAQPEAAKRFEQMTTPELEAQLMVWPTAVAVADVVAAALEIVLPIQDELLPKPEGGAERPPVQPPQTGPADSN